jgi:hypothetical protein
MRNDDEQARGSDRQRNLPFDAEKQANVALSF